MHELSRYVRLGALDPTTKYKFYKYFIKPYDMSHSGNSVMKQQRLQLTSRSRRIVKRYMPQIIFGRLSCESFFWMAFQSLLPAGILQRLFPVEEGPSSISATSARHSSCLRLWLKTAVDVRNPIQFCRVNCSYSSSCE